MMHYILQVLAVIALFLGSIQIIHFSLSMLFWVFRKRSVTASTGRLVKQIKDMKRHNIDLQIRAGIETMQKLSVSDIKKYYKNCNFFNSIEKGENERGTRNLIHNEVINGYMKTVRLI